MAMRIKLTRDEIHQVLTTNMQDWKKYADICEAQDLNEELSVDDIITICSSQFYDALNDCNGSFELALVLDNNFIDNSLSVYTQDTFILIHNIYNK